MWSCCFAVVVPYYCTLGNSTRATMDCLVKPESINVSVLSDQTEKYESSGMIDPTSNMFNDRVFVYHSPNDTRILLGHSLIHALRRV